jgi:RNA polymerase sigma-70 factor (ECF subfamily)
VVDPGKNQPGGGQNDSMSRPDAPDLARRQHFERIFAVAYEPLQRYVRRRGGGADTDDIVAEALTVVWRRLDDVPGGAEVPWCLGVARRCLANQRRADQRRDVLHERAAAHPPTAPADTDPELDRALAQLDEEQRELLRLWAWEGFAPREIAVVMGASPNAISIRLHRARRDLAKLMPERKTAAVAGHIGGRTTEEER